MSPLPLGKPRSVSLPVSTTTTVSPTSGAAPAGGVTAMLEVSPASVTSLPVATICASFQLQPVGAGAAPSSALAEPLSHFHPLGAEAVAANSASATSNSKPIFFTFVTSFLGR